MVLYGITNAPAMMATKESGCPIRGKIGKSLIDRGLNMADTGEASGNIGVVSEKPT